LSPGGLAWYKEKAAQPQGLTLWFLFAKESAQCLLNLSACAPNC
jgi:hypothetical protein